MALNSVSQGRFRPKHQSKYAGNSKNIVFRSSWERTFMQYCDENSRVLKWASEEMHIPYFFVPDGKWHRYFPDFVMVVQTNQGQETWIVEIKPHKQTLPPTGRGRRAIKEAVEYGRNQSKWTAADAYCRKRGWKFRVITEKTLYPQAPRKQR